VKLELTVDGFQAKTSQSVNETTVVRSAATQSLWANAPGNSVRSVSSSHSKTVVLTLQKYLEHSLKRQRLLPPTTSCHVTSAGHVTVTTSSTSTKRKKKVTVAVQHVINCRTSAYAQQVLTTHVALHITHVVVHTTHVPVHATHVAVRITHVAVQTTHVAVQTTHVVLHITCASAP